MRTVLSHVPVLKSSTSGWQRRQVWEQALICTRGICCISLFSNTRGWETSAQISWNIFQKRFVLRRADRHMWLPGITLDHSRSLRNWSTSSGMQCRTIQPTEEGTSMLVDYAVQGWVLDSSQCNDPWLLLSFPSGNTGPGQWPAPRHRYKCLWMSPKQTLVMGGRFLLCIHRLAHSIEIFLENAKMVQASPSNHHLLHNPK